MISRSLAASEASCPRHRAASRHWRKVIPWRWLSLPALVLAFWAVAAKDFDAYLLYPWLDVPTHFSGGIAGVCCVDAFLLRLRPWTGRVHAAVRLALAFGLLACAAIGWEFLEFLSDFLLRTHLNLGVADTLSDLFFGLLGGGWGVAVRRYIDRQKSQSAIRQPQRAPRQHAEDQQECQDVVVGERAAVSRVMPDPRMDVTPRSRVVDDEPRGDREFAHAINGGETGSALHARPGATS